MGKALVLGFAAMFFYAAQNVAVAHKLSKQEPVVTLAIASGTVFILSVAWIVGSMQMGKSMALPPAEIVMFSIMAGVLLFVADLSYYSAYGAGISIIVATTLPVFIPMFVTSIRWTCLDGDKPTLTFYLGIITACVTLWLMTPRK